MSGLRPLGRTGVALGPITYGAMGIGAGDLRDGVSLALLHALERGVTAIDTARAYGDSETIVGTTLRAWRGARPFIATKVAPLPTGDWRFAVDLDQAFTPDSIVASCEQSLRELGVERIDLLQLHQWYARWTHRSEWLDALRRLREQGKIRFIGISAQDHEHDALLPVVEAGLVDVVQVIINLFESRPSTALLPLCAERGVGVIARCVLDDGGLSGALDDGAILTHPRLRKAGGQYLARLARLRDEFGASGPALLELAIRFVLSDPAVTSLAMSMQRPDVVDANLAAAAKGPLDAATVHAIHRRHVWFKNLYY